MMAQLTDIEKIAIRLSKITTSSAISWMRDINVLIAYFGSEVINIFIGLDDGELFERINIGLLSTEYPQLFDVSKVRKFLYA